MLLVPGKALLVEVCLTASQKILMDNPCVLTIRLRQQLRSLPLSLSTKPGILALLPSSLLHLPLPLQARLVLSLERLLRRQQALCSPLSPPLHPTCSVPPSLPRRHQRPHRTKPTRLEATNPTRRMMKLPRSPCLSPRHLLLSQALDPFSLSLLPSRLSLLPTCLELSLMRKQPLLPLPTSLVL